MLKSRLPVRSPRRSSPIANTGQQQMDAEAQDAQSDSRSDDDTRPGPATGSRPPRSPARSTDTPAQRRSPARRVAAAEEKAMAAVARQNAQPTRVSASKTVGGVKSKGGNSLKKPSSLWVDKYAPNSPKDLIGNKTSTTKLKRWLATWHPTFITGEVRACVCTHFVSLHYPLRWNAILFRLS